MVVHPGYNNYTGTLVNGLVYHFQQLPTLPGNDGRPGLVHRIDKDTSGLLLISKNERAMTWLARQFYEHTITRKYLRWFGAIWKQDGTVTGYIGRSINDRRVMSIYDDPEKGKWCGNALQGFGADELCYADRMPAGNRPHPPDTRAHETYRPPLI